MGRATQATSRPGTAAYASNSMDTKDSHARTIGALAAEAPGSDDCIGMEEALRLLTEFSSASHEGAQPSGLQVPVPTSAYCEFAVRDFDAIDDDERESFRAFYERVGGELEDLAEALTRGVDIDEVAWREITDGVRDETSD